MLLQGEENERSLMLSSADRWVMHYPGGAGGPTVMDLLYERRDHDSIRGTRSLVIQDKSLRGEVGWKIISIFTLMTSQLTNIIRTITIKQPGRNII